jgi:hypothetical protein
VITSVASATAGVYSATLPIATGRGIDRPLCAHKRKVLLCNPATLSPCVSALGSQCHRVTNCPVGWIYHSALQLRIETDEFLYHALRVRIMREGKEQMKNRIAELIFDLSERVRMPNVIAWFLDDLSRVIAKL